jgi:hypothetical protein
MRRVAKLDLVAVQAGPLRPQTPAMYPPTVEATSAVKTKYRPVEI